MTNHKKIKSLKDINLGNFYFIENLNDYKLNKGKSIDLTRTDHFVVTKINEKTSEGILCLELVPLLFSKKKLKRSYFRVFFCNGEKEGAVFSNYLVKVEVSEENVRNHFVKVCNCTRVCLKREDFNLIKNYQETFLSRSKLKEIPIKFEDDSLIKKLSHEYYSEAINSEETIVKNDFSLITEEKKEKAEEQLNNIWKLFFNERKDYNYNELIIKLKQFRIGEIREHLNSLEIITENLSRNLKEDELSIIVSYLDNLKKLKNEESELIKAKLEGKKEAYEEVFKKNNDNKEIINSIIEIQEEMFCLQEQLGNLIL